VRSQVLELMADAMTIDYSHHPPATPAVNQ